MLQRDAMSNMPMCVVCHEGSRLSLSYANTYTTNAQASRDLRKEQPFDHILFHSVGGTPDSTDVSLFLFRYRMCHMPLSCDSASCKLPPSPLITNYVPSSHWWSRLHHITQFEKQLFEHTHTHTHMHTRAHTH